MKINKEIYENATTLTGKKLYTYKKVSEKVGSYEEIHGYRTVYFEIDSDEIIGSINESDVRTSWNHYFNAKCTYGWDGKGKTKKEHVKTLCTKAEFSKAYGLLMNEYKMRKAEG